MGWILSAVCLFFLLAGLFFYPMTLMIKATEGRIGLYWLPKLFMGYGRPVRIPVHKILAKSKRERKKRPWRFYWRIARALRLQKLWFDFLFMNPGANRLDGECIISLRVSDIIRKSLRKKWRRIWRDRYVW